MSLISTPPVDRLAVRTYVTPFDPVILREALLRERYRGGQTFYVVPRICDLDDAAAFLAEHTPELKVARAHGQMASRELDSVMNAFYDRQYDVLLSTSIVESGLDIPTANTLIVHHSDMFGLAQLYQLRGRVGRSKVRAYAYITIPADARRRLHAGKPRPGHQRRRQSAWRGAVGPYQGSRLRVVPVDAGGGGDRAEGRRGSRHRGSMEPTHQSRHLGAHPRRLRA